MAPIVRLSDDDIQRIVDALARLVPDPLAKRTYLSIPQLAEYLGWTISKTRHWLEKRKDVRRAKEGHYLIIWRKDIDSQLEIDAATYAAKQRR